MVGAFGSLAGAVLAPGGEVADAVQNMPPQRSTGRLVVKERKRDALVPISAVGGIGLVVAGGEHARDEDALEAVDGSALLFQVTDREITQLFLAQALFGEL